jgi:hypothetical protein
MPSAVSTTRERDIIDKPQQNTPLLMRDFSNLTDIDDIRECLRLLDEEETSIDKSLDAKLAQENKLDKSLHTLSKLG